MWTARIELEHAGERMTRTFLLFSDEALVLEGDAGAVVMEPGNGFNCMPATAVTRDVAGELARQDPGMVHQPE